MINNFLKKGFFMVKISVIIPVYNVEKYLKECLESVLNQTFSDFELICVNDGSTDGSLEILEEYAKKDDRIRIISQENKGQGAARNIGIKNASGEYILFTDSDDFIDLNTLKLTYDNILSNDSDIVMFRANKYSEGKTISFPMYNFRKVFPDADFNNFTFTYKDAKNFVLNGGYNPVTKLYKKEFLDSYDDLYFPEGIAFEDVMFHIKVMLRAKRISHVPEKLYYYRITPKSIMNTPKYTTDIFEMIDIVEEYLIENNYYDEFKWDLDYFKFRRADFHLLKSFSDEYFQTAKRRYSNIKYFDLFKEEELDRFNLVLECNDFIEYLTKLYLIDTENLRKNNKKLKRQNSKLKRENKDLSEKIEELNNLNNEITSSNSWKITKPLRNVGNLLK